MIDIIVNNSTSSIFGISSSLRNEFYNTLSYRDADAIYNDLPEWLGWNRLYNRDHDTFQTGHLSIIRKIIKDKGLDYRVVDERKKPKEIDRIYFKMTKDFPSLRYYQKDMIDASVLKTRGVLEACTGCHAKGTEILMYDGTKKNVEDIIVGDSVMGDDSTPRSVKKLHRGRQLMYKISPSDCDPFIVNKDHILSIKNNVSMNNISVSNFLDLDKCVQGNYRLYRRRIDFSNNTVQDLDPYYLGRVVGGNFNLCSDPNNVIPVRSLTGDRGYRSLLLAGIIDSSDNFIEGRYVYVTTSKELSNNIVFLCRSLGFKASVHVYSRRVGNNTKVKPIENYKISIYGNISEIPISLRKLRLNTKKYDDGIYKVKFKIEPAGVGEYYGFELDGNHLYVMGNFIIAHNSGKTITAMAIIKKLGVPTLFVVPKTSLLTQTRDVFKTYFNHKHIGVISGKKKELDKDITIATYQSLMRVDKKFFDRKSLLLLDEFHHSGATSYQTLNRDKFDNIFYKIGLTSTNFRADGSDLAMQGVLSSVIYKYTVQQAIADGFLVKPYFIIKTYEHEEVYPRYKDWRAEYNARIINNDDYNIRVSKIAKNLAGSKNSTIIFVERIEHGEKLQSMIPCSQFASGNNTKKGQEFNQELINSFNRHEYHILIGTRLIGEGVDTVVAEYCIMAGSVRSGVDVRQKIGRMLRLHGSKKYAVIIDFYHKNTSFMLNQSRERVKIYKTYGTPIKYEY